MKICSILIILSLLGSAQPKPLINTEKNSEDAVSQALIDVDDVRGVADPHKLVAGSCFFEDVPGNDELEQITIRIWKACIPADLYEDNIVDALDEKCVWVAPQRVPLGDNGKRLKSAKPLGNLRAAFKHENFKPKFEYQPVASKGQWSIYIGKIVKIRDEGKEAEARKCVPEAVRFASLGKINMGECKIQVTTWI